jgi:hypothetical protein
MGDLTLNYDLKEFACKCGCGENRVSLVLVNKLQKARDFLGRPLPISSGCRCKKHNAAEGGSRTSSHLVLPRNGDQPRCLAADIPVKSERDAFQKVRALIMAGFVRIGIRSKGNKKFIHVDVDIYKNQDRLWTYNS